MYEKSPPGTSRTLVTVAQQDRSNKTSSTDALQKRPDLNPRLECSEHPRGGKHGREVSRVAQTVSDAPVARSGNVPQEDIPRLPSGKVPANKGHSVNIASGATSSDEDTSQEVHEIYTQPFVPSGQGLGDDYGPRLHRYSQVSREEEPDIYTEGYGGSGAVGGGRQGRTMQGPAVYPDRVRPSAERFPWGGPVVEEDHFHDSSHHTTAYAGDDRTAAGRQSFQAYNPRALDPDLASQVFMQMAPMIAKEVKDQMRKSFDDRFPRERPVLPSQIPEQRSSAPLRYEAAAAFDPSESRYRSDPCVSVQYRDATSDESEEDIAIASLSAPESEDDSHLGGDFPADLINKVAAIFVSHLRYETPVGEARKERVQSHLSFSNPRPPMDTTPVMPVDSECTERFEALASGPKLSTSATKTDKIRFPEEEVKKLFSTPLISEETMNKVRAETAYSGSGVFRSESKRAIESRWTFVDKAARVGMKLASILLLTAESLIRAHQQVPEDQIYFNRAEVGSLVFLLGPLARQMFDQFSRMALKSVRVRRDNLLSLFHWPYPEARARLEQLPYLSSDLFDGRFLETFQKEVQKHKVLAETSFTTQYVRPVAAHPVDFQGYLPPLRGMIPKSAGRSKKKAKPSRPGKSYRFPRSAGASSSSARGRGSRSVNRGRSRGRARGRSTSFSDQYFNP